MKPARSVLSSSVFPRVHLSVFRYLVHMPDDLASAAERLANSPEFRAAISEDHPDLEAIRETVIQAYSAETGIPEPDLERVSSWFEHVCRAYDSRVQGGICTERPILRRVMSSTIARKAEHLMARPCRQCDMYSEVDYILFFLKIRPKTHQSSNRAQRRLFKQDIAADLRRKNFDFSDFTTQRLCVSITFFIAEGRRLSDVDNLSKNLLDALESFAYKNDRQIDHLDLLRLRSYSSDEFFRIRISCTDIDDVRDVISPTFNVRWLSRTFDAQASGPVYGRSTAGPAG